MKTKGVGPIPCKYMLIGPYVGYRENETGIPFSPGKSWTDRYGVEHKRHTAGDELERFLDGKTLPDRRQWYLTNLHKTYQGKDYVYTQADVDEALPELIRELQRVTPSVIVTMGREVTRLFLGDVDVQDVQGLPYEGVSCNDCGWTTGEPEKYGNRLLALGRKTTTGRAGESQHLFSPEAVEGPQSSVHNARRRNTCEEDSRPPLQQHVVSKSHPRRYLNSSAQQRESQTTPNALQKRTPPYLVSVAEESFFVTAEARHQEPVLPRVFSCGSPPELEQAQRQVQPCPTCGSTNFRRIVIFGMVHIAAGMRNSDLSVYVVGGFQGLAAYLRGDVAARRLFDDPYAGQEHYEEITTTTRLDELTSDWTTSTHVAIDTEGWPGNPWSLQFSTDAGAGYLLRATAPDLLRQFGTILRRSRPRLTFHSALHDLAMGRALGIDFSGLPFDDTMVMAYLLQIEPQGLKAGCLRHCNMRMQDYADLVGDKANDLARDYLTWLWDAEQVDYEERQQAEFDRLTTTPYVDAKGRLKPGRKLRTLPKLPRTPLQRAVSRVLGSARPHALWQDQVEDLHVAAYRRLGPLPTATLDYVPEAVAVAYGCRDTDGTTRLRHEYERRVDSMGVRAAYDLELATYPLLDRMQQVGILPDLEQFADLSGVLSGEIVRLQEDLVETTGLSTFNANSGDQVAEYLFGTLKLDEVKLTSTGRGSTNDKILEALEHEHPEYPVLTTIRAYRETYKLKHTFVDRIPDYVHRWPHDGRIHTTLRTTRVVTGRLASADPNLLAQPEHGAFADEFKRGWIAAPGRYVYAWDESQIELRGLAHLSQDTVLLHAFRSGIDLHATLAERIFGIKPKNQDKHKHRQPAKAINFGIPMGMTCRGLSVELRKNGVDADEDTAQRWLDETLGLYAGVARYMEGRKNEARQNGFVRCLSGRIRYIGGIRSRDERVREEAERFAFSTPIQESAQYVMKTAESYIWDTVLPYFWKRGRWVEPLLQVHDCLRMEGEQSLAQELNVAMRKAMIEIPAHLFSVPLDVEGEYGLNLADVEKFK